MKSYARLILIYEQTNIKLIRLAIFFLLTSLILYQLVSDYPPNISIFLLNYFLIIEVFFRFKINRVTPKISVDKNDGKDIFESFTLPALKIYLKKSSTKEIVKSLHKFPQVKMFMQKINMKNDELVESDLPKETLAKSALEVAKTFSGKYVTTLDMFIAYLLLTESQSKLMFAKQMKNEDLGLLLSWLRKVYSHEEFPPKIRMHFFGGGVADFLIIGWTPETKKYTSNFTEKAIKNEALTTGRKEELKSLLEGLTRAENNNVLIIGNAGIGKENLVRAFAWHSFAGSFGKFLNDYRVLELSLGSFMAGAANRNDLETRLQFVVAELSHSGRTILYIPEFQNIMGASSYNLDISGALMPYLKSGNMPIIATMSAQAYKAYMDRNPIKEVFSLLALKEPDKNTAIQMTLEKTSEIESKNKVIISYKSVVAAVELAGKYFQDQSLPGSAVNLLQSVANKVALSTAPEFEKTHRKIVLEGHLVKYTEDTIHVAIGMPGKKEINTLLHLEDKLHERIIDQKEAVSAIAEALRRIRSGMKVSQKPVSFLFLGPTGVGKTETTKALSDLYFGGQRQMIRLDMSEYTDSTGVLRLLGSPPGQGNERGELTDKIHDAPASLVLLDEFEKAHPKIHDLFLQVLDDGRLTDNKGRTVSFSNALVIATSNAGSEFIREEVEKGTPIDKKFQSKLLDYLQTNKIFKPELLNRFDDVITFKPLGPADVKALIDLMLQKQINDLKTQDINLTFDDAVLEKIAKEGYDPQFGGRPLSRYIQDNITNLIATKKLQGEIVRGKNINIGVDGALNIILTVQ